MLAISSDKNVLTFKMFKVEWEVEQILSLGEAYANSTLSFSEAIHAILVYSQSVEELLKRRKVYREIIFKYLAQQGVAVPPSSEKHQLIHYAKQYWNQQLSDKPSERKDVKFDKKVSALFWGT